MRKLVIFGMILLAACGQNKGSGSSESAVQTKGIEAEPTKADFARAADLVPADDDLAAKYDRSCRICHSSSDAAAPLTGHIVNWDARFAAKGSDGMLRSTKSGLNAMPPMGLCSDCTDEELVRLTSFMAGRAD